MLVLDVQTHLNVFVDLDHRRTLDVTAGSDADPNSELFRGSGEQLLLELDNISVEWGAALYTDTLLETHLLVVEAQFLDGSVATVGVDDLLLGLHVDHVIDGGLVDGFPLLAQKCVIFLAFFLIFIELLDHGDTLATDV